jgi:hypothetical protein
MLGEHIWIQLLRLPACPLCVRMQLCARAYCCALCFAFVMCACARACRSGPPMSVPPRATTGFALFLWCAPVPVNAGWDTQACAPTCCCELHFTLVLCARARACRWGPPTPASLPAHKQRPPAPAGDHLHMCLLPAPAN